MKKPDDGLPIEMWIEHFTAKTVRLLHRQIMRCALSGQEVLPVYIGSWGGNVNELGAMQDLIESSPVAVSTIAIGKATSAGADLLAAGTKGFRVAMPGACIMVHESADALGYTKIREMSAETKECERLERLFFARLDKNCGKPKGYFWKELTRRKFVNWWMAPKEAKKHGLIDQVGVPRYWLNTTVGATFSK